MVVGNGLVAHTFDHYKEEKDVIVFASGVSNSALSDPVAFRREIDLVNQFAGTAAVFIYFSTVSIFYPCLERSAYVLHKKKVEDLVRTRFPNHLLFRLPNLVGRTRNPNTLTNFLHHCISGRIPFELHRDASRYLLDADDMKILCSAFIDDFNGSGTHNILFDNACDIYHIVKIFEEILGLKGEYNETEKGCGVYLDPLPDTFLSKLSYPKDYHIGYVERVLKKYYNPGTVIGS